MFADRVLSGMRPTGRMHIGHYHGALKNWVRLQEEYACLFFAADWHALTTHYEAPEVIAETVWEMFVDWLAAGIDPTRATMFIQSRVPEHAELALLLGMITPLGWLERVPTYKDQQQKLADRDLSTYGFLGYPADAGRRHPDLSREHGAGGRGPGLAHRTRRARSRAASTTSTAREPGFEDKAEGRGEEAGQPRRHAATASCAPRSRSRATTRRSRPRASC